MTLLRPHTLPAAQTTGCSREGRGSPVATQEVFYHASFSLPLAWHVPLAFTEKGRTRWPESHSSLVSNDQSKALLGSSDSEEGAVQNQNPPVLLHRPPSLESLQSFYILSFWEPNSDQFGNKITGPVRK